MASKNPTSSNYNQDMPVWHRYFMNSPSHAPAPALFRGKPIAHAHHGLDDERVGRVGFDLAAQAVDHVLEHGVIRLGGIAPDLLVELLGGDDLPGPVHQVVQQAQLEVRQLDHPAVPEHHKPFVWKKL